MITKLKWFILGFLASWMLWSVIAAVRSRPRDLQSLWEIKHGEKLPDSLPWLKHAKARKLGRWFVIVPADESNAAICVSLKERKFPHIIVTDSYTNGVPDEIVVGDSKFKAVTVLDNNGDALFDSYIIRTGISSNSVILSDNTFSGNFDERLSFAPRAYLSVNLSSNWYDLVWTNGAQHVMHDGRLRRVDETNGTWHFIDH